MRKVPSSRRRHHAGSPAQAFCAEKNAASRCALYIWNKQSADLTSSELTQRFSLDKAAALLSTHGSLRDDAEYVLQRRTSQEDVANVRNVCRPISRTRFPSTKCGRIRKNTVSATPRCKLSKGVGGMLVHSKKLN